MKTYTVGYHFYGSIPVEAENEDEARRKFEQQDALDLARHALDSLEMLDVSEEGPLLPEPEGLSSLKADDMMHRAKW